MTRWLVLLLVAVTLLAVAPEADARRTAAECRAACGERNVPASCKWLSPSPRGCVLQAIRACETSTAAGTDCPLPSDLPACGSNQGCPFGSLCVDATCQVVGCGSHAGVADCTGTNRCDGDKCVVADCAGVDANCARGFHCTPGTGLLGSLSGTCEGNTPGTTYCAFDTDCIAPGSPNPRCLGGVCGHAAARNRRARCTADTDCFRACLRGSAVVRVPLCDAAGTCVCGGCTDDADCNARFSCGGGQPEVCRPNGTCFCPPVSGGGGGGGGGFPTNLPPGNYALTICISGTASIPCQSLGVLPFAGAAAFKTALLDAIDQWLAATAGSDCTRGAATYSAFDGSSFTVTIGATCGSASETIQITARLV
jgi:hypothetical protein